MFTRIASASILLALPLVAFAVPIDGTDQARDDAAIVPTLGVSTHSRTRFLHHNLLIPFHINSSLLLARSLGMLPDSLGVS